LGVSTALLADQSIFIEGSLRQLRGSAILGGLLAVLVLFLFLQGVAPTAIIALTIPLSIISAFGPMQLSGLSLNVMSLGGLALGIGMLVDNSIVVLESIHRCRSEGDNRRQAAIRGTGEVAQAVIASTLTTMAVFFPMVFVEGVAGQVFGDLALVVVFALAASLIFALTFIPMLAALGARDATVEPGAGADPATDRMDTGLRRLLIHRLESLGQLRDSARALAAWRRREPVRPWRRLPGWLGAWLLLLLRLPVTLVLELSRRLLLLLIWILVVGAAWLARRLGRLLDRLGGLLGKVGGRRNLGERYSRLLRHALERPGRPLAIVLLLLLCAALLAPRLGQELIPQLHQGEFYVEAELPVGTPLERTAAQLAGIEAFLGAQPEVAGVALVAGADTQGGIDTEGGDHVARLTVRLKESRDPRRVEEAVLARLRPRLADLPDVKSRVGHPVLFSYKTPIEVQIMGHDLADLRESARRAAEALADLPGLTDLHTSSGGGNPEIHVRFRREELARLGLDLQEVARLLRQKVLGGVETEFRDVEQRIDIRVRLRPEDLLGLEDIRALVVNPGGPVPVPLGAVAEVGLNEGPSEIRRLEQERTALLRANLGGLDLGRALPLIRARLDRLPWPEGQRWEVTGQSAEMKRSLDSLYLALALAIFLVFVVMASQFESLVHPLVILAAVPLAFLGVVPVLALLQVPVSILVFLGAILLVGIVVNNAILLVDTIKLFRREGFERREAVVKAGAQRLRPILMTTLTTVLGLLPLALGLGDGAELRRPMALTVIVGLSTSTLLTLFIIPVLYEGVERLLDRLRPVLRGPGGGA
jgi:HAE1 family hydrophobic/amphiphilic exporter-1